MWHTVFKITPSGPNSWPCVIFFLWVMCFWQIEYELNEGFALSWLSYKRLGLLLASSFSLLLLWWCKLPCWRGPHCKEMSGDLWPITREELRSSCKWIPPITTNVSLEVGSFPVGLLVESLVLANISNAVLQEISKLRIQLSYAWCSTNRNCEIINEC